MSFISFRTLTALGLLSAGLGVAFVGCSSDDTSSNNPPPDGGKDTGSDTSTGGSPIQKGQLVELLPGSSGDGASGLTVDLGGKTASSSTTAPKGSYSISVGNSNPFFMRVTGPGHAGLIEQEWFLSGDADRGKTPVPSSTLVQGLAGLLDGIDGTKGALGVSVVNLPPCADNGGATVELDTGTSGDAGTDAGDSGSDAGGTDAGTSNVIVRYFGTNGFPDKNLTSVQKGVLLPSAIIYNLPPGEVTIKVKHPSCTQNATFPFPDPLVPNIKYTGKMKVEAAGDVKNGNGIISFARIFLK
ncbi:hypothetical protein LVJ94_30400 [Pendulispora rubella]|uniref:Lipoprotein n=1 Tax=Pendulispora rubella TaxID=2741070 RepID=A0ABZ2KRB2_9BACT